MNKLKLTTIVLSAFFLFSCNSKTKEETTQTNQTTETEVHNHDDHEAVQLDNGKKWKVDDNMMVHINQMEKDIATLNQPEDFEKLSENLNKNVDLLTANCTMKGQAHDELHKWLLPYIDLVNDFSKDKSAENLQKITASFASFKNYFE